jgi:PEP-CTERM motif-containing protein
MKEALEMTSRSVITAAIVLIVLGCTPLFATVLSGPEYFNTIPHAFVDFETDGSGATVLLGENSSRSMPSDEYATLGFTFDTGASWLNDGGSSTQQAQAIYGGGINVMKFPYQNIFSIYFSTPIDAFGFWLMKSNLSVNNPLFEAYTYGSNGLIETAEFSGSLIDDSIGVIDYGFLGITTDQPITRIDITTNATLTLDNFMFVQVPEPTTLLLISLGGLFFRKSK